MSPGWNRILVAVMAVACLVAAFAIALTDSMDNLWCGSFVRAGLLLGALWIGLPTKGRAAAWANVSPYWILAAGAGIVLIGRVVKRPQVLIPFIAAFFILTWVWPLLTGRRR
ncbi:hypothetical protein [Planctomicrobium piriforme]|uniref:Uncharacterized protein n=1 Tax=Planctomicrobium piriforme TaxID=1576369 RepID=A0A1I3J1Y5_9PLAN|nr:hypothetical protein [Planctomicrobium piriforme]SFI54095.1 hypothetical protein SAMN05421753_11028 [Planctomicrobium piriforme]